MGETWFPHGKEPKARDAHRPLMPEAASTSAHASVMLDPRRPRGLRLASTAHGRTRAMASRTLSGPSPPARSTRPSASAACSRWNRDPRLPRAGRAPAPQVRHSGRGPFAGPVAVLLRVELHQIGFAVVAHSASNEHPYRQHRRRHGGRAAPAWGSPPRTETGEVGARLRRGGDVLLAGQPAHLDERAREELASLAAGSSARMSAEPTRIASAPASSASAAWA